jgi:DNA-binding response OmpR family regulator
MAPEDPITSGLDTPANILIVDDNVEVVELLSDFLSRESYAFGRAYTGRGALEMILSKAFDVILLDITLPDIDGLEVLRRTRAEGSSCRLSC